MHDEPSEWHTEALAKTLTLQYLHGQETADTRQEALFAVERQQRMLQDKFHEDRETVGDEVV